MCVCDNWIVYKKVMRLSVWNIFSENDDFITDKSTVESDKLLYFYSFNQYNLKIIKCLDDSELWIINEHTFFDWIYLCSTYP